MGLMQVFVRYMYFSSFNFGLYNETNSTGVFMDRICFILGLSDFLLLRSDLKRYYGEIQYTLLHVDIG